MDCPNYFTRDFFRTFQIYFDIDDRLFAQMQQDIRKKIEESEDISVDEVINYWLERYWRRIFSDSIFDLFYLQCINFFRQTFGFSYSTIINDVIKCFINVEGRFKELHEEGLDIFNSEALKMQEPMELLNTEVNEVNRIQDVFINKKTLVRLLLEDALIAVCEFLDHEEAVAIVEKNKKHIEEKDLSFEDLVQSLEEECFSFVHVGSATENIRDSISQDLGDLILESYPGFVDGRKFLGSAISLVQFKFLTDAVIEELQDKYRDENTQGKFIFVEVWERGGAYNIKLVDREPMRYKFNPKYTSEIGISIMAHQQWQDCMDSDYKKHDVLGTRVIISGLYHWDLQLLSLDLPDGKSLMITSPEREPFNEKDILEMERYLKLANKD